MSVPQTFKEFEKWLKHGPLQTVNTKEILKFYERALQAGSSDNLQEVFDALRESLNIQVVKEIRRGQEKFAPVMSQPKPELTTQVSQSMGSELDGGAGVNIPFEARPGLEGDAGANIPKFAKWFYDSMGVGVRQQKVDPETMQQLYELHKQLSNKLKLKHIATPKPGDGVRKEEKPEITPTIKPIL